MGLENIKKANEFLKELQKTRAEKTPRLREAVIKEIRKAATKDRKPPKEFVDSSYLYIRSYDGDNGTRPGLNVPYWKSPDLLVAPLSSLNSYTTELVTGQAYNLKCLVHNRGDLNVPSAKVEFYLVTPSLGFDTRFAKKLGVVNTWVNCYSSAEANLTYFVPVEDAGHKCLFARVFSFSPLDIPLHDTKLDPRDDRHIGQKNLNIAGQASQMQFNLLHMPIANMEIQLRPMTIEGVKAMRHPMNADFQFLEGEKFGRLLNEFKMAFAERQKIGKMEFKEGIARLTFNGESRYSLEMQRKIEGQSQKILALINSGKRKSSEFKRELKELREMNAENMMTPFKMKIPNLGLKKGEAVGFEIVGRNATNGVIIGGITLIVKG